MTADLALARRHLTIEEKNERLAALRLQLVRAGYTPLPLFGKSPPIYGKNNNAKGLSGWQNLRDVSTEQIAMWGQTWPDAVNTGVLTATVPALDIDIMNEEAAAAVETLCREHFEERGHILVRVGKPPKRAILLRTDEPFNKIIANVIAPNGNEEKIELLANGQQLVAFGVHPDTQRHYRWHGGEPGQIARETLPYIREEDAHKLVNEAVELLIFSFGYTRAPERPQRKKANGGDERDTGEDWVYLLTNIHEGRALHDSLRDLAAKQVAAGMNPGAIKNQLRALMHVSAAARDDRWHQRAGEIAGLVDSAVEKYSESVALFDPWQRYIAPSFPVDILPAVVQDFVQSQAAIIGCDISGMAMSVLGAFSGALHHSFALKMIRNGNWYASPRLWLLFVADPSQRKTPMLNTATRPLVHYEGHLREKYEEDLRKFEEAKAESTQQRKLEPPRRYVAWDTTTEKLGELLTRSDRGILVLRDELSGWLGSMERYNTGHSDRAFWLQAYDGGPHSIDRIKRGELFVRNLSTSIMGCIQPQRLAEAQGLTSDGLLQRFLPTMLGPASFAQDCRCDIEEEAYGDLFRQLIFTRPARLIMDDGALGIVTDLRQHLFDIEQTSGGLAAGFQSFVGKLHGIAGSLALILQMAHDPATGATYAVGEQIAANVRRLMLEFILPHGREFYCGTEAPGERLRRLASWILTSGKLRVVASDLSTNVADCRGLTVRELNERVSPLVAGGWLQPENLTPMCRAWQVNPQVHRQLAERAKIEDARKATLAKLMGSPRGLHGTA